MPANGRWDLIRRLKFKPRERAFKQFKSPVLNVLKVRFLCFALLLSVNCRDSFGPAGALQFTSTLV